MVCMYYVHDTPTHMQLADVVIEAREVKCTQPTADSTALNFYKIRKMQAKVRQRERVCAQHFGGVINSI